MTYRDFMLGPNVYILSRVEYKNAMLRSQLAVFAMLVSIGYFFIDRYHGVYGSEPYYFAACGVGLITLVLNRLQKYYLASLLFLLMANLLIFYFSLLDPRGSGVLMFFVATSLIAFALLGYKNLKLAFAFILLSVALFLMSFWVEFDFVQRRTYTEEYLEINFIVNFLISLSCSIAIMYFLMDLNHHSEKEILAKNDQLEKANAELDRFVYSASHDLKAPLSSLLGLVELAKLDEKEIPKYLDMMKARIHDMEEFIREIISYSRNSQMEIAPQQVSLRNVVDEIIEKLMFADPRRSLVIENRISENYILHTDVVRLKVIMSNLISNSIKYYDEQKEKSFVKIEADQNDSRAMIFVRDNGVGIHSEHHDKIFTMFYRASEKSKGSGLGLYIVKETLAKINGTVKVESAPGEGTTFIITLPLIAG